jgi:hypothetical protein
VRSENVLYRILLKIDDNLITLILRTYNNYICVRNPDGAFVNSHGYVENLFACCIRADDIEKVGGESHKIDFRENGKFVFDRGVIGRYTPELPLKLAE